MTPRSVLRRPPEGVPLLLALDTDSPEPLFRQIYRTIRQAVLGGRLGPGVRLPSSRILAADLGVSRNTVVAAFEQLHAEGYLDSRVGRGTHVAHTVPDVHQRAAGRRPAAPAWSPPAPVRAARRSEALREAATPRSLLRDAAPAFRPGVPALDHFPVRLWNRIAGARARRVRPALLNYSADPLGFAPLRRAVTQYLGAARGVTCDVGQVFIVAGTQQALALSALVTLDPGDVAWVEDPGYYGARGALVAAGARAVSVPVDGEGLDVDAGPAIAANARLVYVSPSHQFPLGVTLGLGRRMKLLNWARAAGAWVVEDDYDSEFRYSSRPLAALHGLGGAECVIYCGTFSKILFPSLRIGYAVVPPALVDAFTAARLFADVQHSTLDQAVLADFIEGGHFERHIRRMRTLYRGRRDALLAALAEESDAGITAGPADAGMHVTAWLPPGVDAFEVQRRAAARGVDAIPVAAFAVDCAPPEGLVLGYAHLDEAQIRDACRRLAAAVSSAAAARRDRA